MIKGLATGIGSLPHAKPEEAVDLVLRFLPEAPFWPQLPKRDKREGMVAQFREDLPLPGLPGGDSPEKLEEFYAKVIGGSTEYFRISEEYAAGLYAFKERLIADPGVLESIEFIKCQITGPFSFAASLKDRSGKALLHDHTMMQVVIKGLIMKGLWQINFFKQFNKKIILFIDEPYLGCLGSAYTPINRTDVVAGLTELTEEIKKQGALLGVHCCGNTDWSIFTEIPALDIINFDAFGFLEKFTIYAGDLKNFISRGGLICWGVVPTQEFSAKITPAGLLNRLLEGIDLLVKKGLPRESVVENLIISPACGLGSLEPERAASVFEVLTGLSSLIRKNL